MRFTGREQTTGAAMRLRGMSPLRLKAAFRPRPRSDLLGFGLLLVLALTVAPLAPAQFLRHKPIGVHILDSTPAQAGAGASKRHQDGTSRMLRPRINHDSDSSLPVWKGTLTHDNVTYSFTMIGTDPALGSATTTVPTVIIPLRFQFADGNVFDPTTDVFTGGVTALQGVLNSPVFQHTSFSSGQTDLGFTQYVDAFQRGSFWNVVATQSPGYHVLLGQPQVLAAQVLNVPADKESTEFDPLANTLIGNVDPDWLNQHAIDLISRLGISTDSLPIFLTGKVDELSETEGFFGYHSWVDTSTSHQGRPGVQTYIVSCYEDYNLFGFGGSFADINTLSHEVAEWMNDPFLDNTVPPWGTPPPFFNVCFSPLLEVGDPVVFNYLTVPLNGVTYHPQDLVFLSWFAREMPSTAVNGYYDFTNQVRTFSEPCPDTTHYSLAAYDVPGSSQTVLEGINNRGQIVGWYRDGAGQSHGLLLDDGIATPIDISGSTFIVARKINDLGQITGYYVDQAGHFHGFLVSQGNLTQIEVPGAADTFALGINNQGDVVGGFDGVDGINHGFLLRRTQFVPVDAPFAFSDEIAAINDRGSMVGDYDTGNVTDDFGFLVERSRFTKLNFPGAGLTGPTSINNSGDVVGYYSYNPDLITFFSGFVRTGDLFSRINFADQSGVHPTLLRGGNDRGVQVGYYFHAGLHGLIATPHDHDN